MAFSVEYDFEEVRLFGAGVMAWGTATLTDNGDGQFYVSRIVLDADKGETPVILRRPGTQRTPSYNEQTFCLIADQIENSPRAEEFWAEERKESRKPDPDRAYDERRDHQAMEML